MVVRDVIEKRAAVWLASAVVISIFSCANVSSAAVLREVMVETSAPVDLFKRLRIIDGEDSFLALSDGEQIITLNLGYEVSVQSVTLDWTFHCAEEFDIQLSRDGKNYKTVESVTGLKVPKRRRTFAQQPGKTTYDFPEQSASYVRLLLKKAAVPEKGYELIELRINKQVPICFAPVPETAVSRDSSAAADARLDDLIRRITFREKLHFTGGFDFFLFPGLPRFGLKPVLLNDTSAGVVIRSVDHTTAGARLHESTGFPVSSALAATWNPALAKEMGGAIAEECRAHGTGVLLGPGMNIHRTSICGRNFEYYSEDPLLSAQMAVPFIQGVQEKGIIATAKHLVVNNNEFLRFDCNAIVDERALHEIYLPAFKASVQEGGVLAIMSSYNWLNGQKCGEYKYLLTDVLRGEMGYTGMVMTDWNGSYDRKTAPGTGQNIIMPAKRELYEHLMRQYESDPAGTERQVEEMIRPTLRVLLVSGVWDRPVGGEEQFVQTLPEHKDIARRIGEEAVTLLKNEGVLPVEKGTSVLVSGSETSVLKSSTGAGSGGVKGYDHVTYLDGLKARFPDTVYNENPSDEDIRDAGCVFYFFEMGDREGSDRPFELPEATVSAIRRLTGLSDRVVVVASTGTAFEMDWIDEVEGLVHCFFLGQERGNSFGAVVAGEVNPSGKLPFSMEKKYADSPAYGDNVFDGKTVWSCTDPVRQGHKNLDVTYDEGIFVGYRWYDAKNKPVHFPFGFGLSYTTFSYEGLQVENQGSLGLRVSFRVYNTGRCSGQETAQVYVGQVNPPVEREIRELSGFRKVEIAAGEVADVSIDIPLEQLAVWDTTKKDWVVPPGAYTVWVGGSSRELPLSTIVKIQ